MAAAFRDTFFAYILRSAFGSRVFPHPDEKVLPTVWQEKLSSHESPRDSAAQSTLDVPSPDVTSIHSDATLRRIDPETGKDTLLVEWNGPTDPDVSYRCATFVPHLFTPATVSESTELV